ncbi:MAG: NAD/NADP octopine/nopaline dehydrogenase family protein, partial [Oscillospiraceae bacterium]
MKIAVLGAGPGALALSACLVQKGYRVSLYEQPAFAQNIKELALQKTILADGCIQGRATLDCVTTELAQAVSGARFLFLVTHAAAHLPLAHALAPLIERGQTIVLFPGYLAGALCFERELRLKSPSASPVLIESSALPFACRRTGPCSVFVGGLKREFLLSCRQQHPDLQPLTDLFGEIPTGQNLLETGLNETNFIIHACISLSNLGLVESGRDWSFYREGLPPSVGRLIEAVDQERLALLRELDLPQISLAQWLLRFYGDQGARGDTAYEVLTHFDYFATSKGPRSFSHRYFTEDLPYGLVPLAALGEAHGVSMTAANALIDLANRAVGTDFR